jgi:hypothetical protein
VAEDAAEEIFETQRYRLGPEETRGFLVKVL